ncbi:MAG: glycoside hydrolase family 43 protein [Bryobacterales bacterium]|nr:glycoside hydrolase family 43 protein [Bryobacterales bacterium]
MLRKALLFIGLAFPSLAADVLLFSFFRGNGETGLYLAESADGLRWRALHGDRPLLTPRVGESKLMRDPSIARGPDGVFHMVWTTSWRGATLGYASSRDLRVWSEQKTIPCVTEALNCWAPEVFYDETTKDFVVVWASTVPGRFPETAGQGAKDYNHRLYIVRTKDFATFTPAKLFYEPGFQVIDGALFRRAGKYWMVAKNETERPPAKHLFLTSANSLDGPWSPPSAPISGPQWAEGASPIRIGSHWYIYFDKYRDKKYGAVRSKDLQSWEDVTDSIAMPDGVRHGTVFRAPEGVVRGLR